MISIAHSTTRSKDWDDVLTAHTDEPFVRSWSVPNKRLGKHTWNYAETSKRKAITGSVKVFCVVHVKIAVELMVVQCVCVTACGNFGIAGSSTGEIHMWNLQSGIKRRTFKIVPSAQTATEQMDPLKFGESENCITGLATDALNRVVVASTSNAIYVRSLPLKTRNLKLPPFQFFDFHSAKLDHNLVFPTSVSSISLHRNSGLLAVVCGDMTIRIIDIDTRRVVRELVCGSKDQVLDIVRIHIYLFG